MTQNEYGAYGIQRPKFYVYWRGLHWLRQGFCPNCYSSPPHEECWVCDGNFNYGYHLSAGDQLMWRTRWQMARDYEKNKRSIRGRLRRRRTHKREAMR